MNNTKKIMVAVAIVAIVGFAATSFAGWGRGWGAGGNCWGPGGDWSQGQRPVTGYRGHLSDQDIAELNQARQAFLEDTRELRENLYQKRLELRSEIAKQDPDLDTALALQKEVSDLKAQLDQKRIAQRIKMKKENPDLGVDRGFGRGYGHGPRGKGLGRGFANRGGGCWY
jgi:hypothetical protein